MRKSLLLPVPFLALFAIGVAYGGGDGRVDRFKQLEDLLPTPGPYRTASGAPGHDYWQQRVDYRISAELDEAERAIRGSETVTYHNNSPDTLSYLWVQIDPNIFSPESHAVKTSLAPDLDSPSFSTLQRVIDRTEFDGSAKITSVQAGDGTDLAHTIVGTMMRIDLPTPLQSGASTVFSIDWNYRINDHDKVGGRTGYEYFEKDDNAIFEIAQWFPRMAAYTDATGWQHKQFLGRGEFTLEFGDYHVELTVPSDHVVAATGVLQNPDEVLTQVQRDRLADAQGDEQVFIVTPEEAVANQDSITEGTKTWVFEAENVRDFSWASSRKFIWDARVHPVEGGHDVLAMSFYPIEGEPLWSKYSTSTICHTLDVYSKFTFPYPYPVAISVNGPVGGMEYPMICFNGPRPEEDGTYSARTKYGLISVIIHEVGHNWFPMVVNSDERQWTWMDEGLNSFVQYLAEQEWEDDYPSRSGEPRKITRYMASANQMPIMTNSESILQFGANAYAKPATALNILRETVMGRSLFDFSFQTYARRWMFKRPMPADLFRTMEDASAVDLDWFWRGWFFTTDHVDLSIDGVRAYRIDTGDPDIERPLARAERDSEPKSLSQLRNAALPKRIEAEPRLADFYNSYDELDITPKDREEFAKYVDGLDDDQLRLLRSGLNLYVVDITNRGGIPMPVILEAHYEDGTSEEFRVPVEIWRGNAESISKLIMTPRVLERIDLDPHLETADTNLSDNVFPRPIETETKKLRASGGWSRGGGSNPMREAREAAEARASADG